MAEYNTKKFLDIQGLISVFSTIKKHISDFFKSIIESEEVEEVAKGDECQILVTYNGEIHRVTYSNLVKQYNISSIPNRNQIVYTTLDNNVINVEHSALESNVYHVDKGFGILTFTSNNFNNVSLADNENLYSVRLPEGMTALAGKTFQNCVNLQEVYLPNSITSFSANDTFDNCQSLRHITLPNALEKTGGYTFRNCMSLEEMYLPDTLTNQPMMTSLKSIRFIKLPTNSSFTKVGSLGNCTSLEKIYLPSNIDTIEASAFSGCYNLRDINLDKIKYIGAGAFNNCSSIREITIPATQELLGQDIVSRTNLDKLVIKATQPQFHQFTFSGTIVRHLDYYGEYLPSECDLPLSEIETLILRSNKSVLATVDGEYTLDKQIRTVYSWIKIYVPKTLLEGYKEAYPRLTNNLYSIEA